jgi:MFS family permease
MTKSKYYQEELKEQERFLPSPFTRQPLALLWIYFILAFLSGNCLVASNSMQLLTFHLGYLAWIPISDAELYCHIAIAVGMSINFLGFLFACFLVQKVPINVLGCCGFMMHSIAWLLLAWYRTYSALVISFSCIGLGNAFVYIALQSIAPSFSCEKVELEILAFLSIPDAVGILLPKLLLSFLHIYPSHDGLVLFSWSCSLFIVAILCLFLFPYCMSFPREPPLFLSFKKYLSKARFHSTLNGSKPFFNLTQQNPFLINVSCY